MTEPSEKEVEAVRLAVRDKRDSSLCAMCRSPHRIMIRCTCDEIARAAIAAYEKAKAEEYERNTMS